MALERRPKGNGTHMCILTACPACGMELAPKGGSQLRWHLLREHTPADFGLTATPDDYDAIGGD